MKGRIQLELHELNSEDKPEEEKKKDKKEKDKEKDKNAEAQVSILCVCVCNAACSVLCFARFCRVLFFQGVLFHLPFASSK